MYVRGDGDDQLDDNWLPPYNGAAGYFGAGYPTATWAAVMKLDLEGEPIEKFPPPANVEAKQTDHTPAPTTAPPPTRRTSRPPSSAPTSSAPTSSAPTKPTHGPSSTGTGPTCFPPGHCSSSSPTASTSATSAPPTSAPASARPLAMQELWW
jgi:cytoskeletal protein RodZ